MAATKRAPEAWIPKAEAAELLKISPRQLERREQQGFIEKRTEPRRPNESAGRVLYSRTDIEALKAGTPNTHARLIEPAEKPAPPTSTAIARRDPQPPEQIGQPAQLATIPGELLAMIAKAAAGPAAAPRPWLTLSEAAEYSGLPASFLQERARAGKGLRSSGPPIALNVGTGTREFWRFRRAALD